MFEADTLCDRIAVIAQGRIVAEGTPQALKAGVAEGTVVEVEVYGIEDAVVERVRLLEGVSNVGLEERNQKQVLVVQTLPGRELVHAILGHLDSSEVGRVSSREPTLEDAYVALVDE